MLLLELIYCVHWTGSVLHAPPKPHEFWEPVAHEEGQGTDRALLLHIEDIFRQGLKVQSETMPCDAVLRYVAFGSESARQHGHFVMW